MAKPGPNPKRPEERRRNNSPDVEVTDLSAIPPLLGGNDILDLIMEPIQVPEVDGIWAELPEPDDDGTITFDPNDESQFIGWHPLATDFWESMKRSGQVVFWEPTDWMLAVVFCENLSRLLKPQYLGMQVIGENGEQKALFGLEPMNGASMNALLKLAAQIGLSEGERRSMGMILERKRDERPKLATVSSADDRRREMAKPHSA